ncbi:MAG: FAD-binding oxidoreductase [Isosphaeraceae bacterium]
MQPAAGSPVTRRRPAPQDLLRSLGERFGERYSTGESDLHRHGRDDSPYDTTPPDCIVFPESVEEVAEVVRLCARHLVPIIAYGAGTSIEGHIMAVEGGVTVDLSRMNRLLAVNAEDLTATVEAGVTRKQLNAAIEGSGLFFPVDPGADATLGGMAATRASGSAAVRYGTMRENVVGLKVVTADGATVRTGGRARKSAAGYDLTRIFVGSEGTLGIITEVTVRLYPRPEAVSAAVCPFPDVAGAVDTVIRTIQRGVPIARAELLDALTVTAVNRYSQTELQERPTLFLEFHGTPASVAEQAEAVQAIARQHGGRDFEWAVAPAARSRLWDARHSAFPAILQLRPGARAFVTDACVPISRLAECIAATIEDTRASSLPCPILGHVGDGNFHCIILADPNNAAEMDEAERLNQRVMRRALESDGTCTGEHGVGMHKISLLGEEFGDAGVDLMRRLKAAWDPLNILNPGKIVMTT